MNMIAAKASNLGAQIIFIPPGENTAVGQSFAGAHWIQCEHQRGNLSIQGINLGKQEVIL
jgi:hypothetical protein